MKRLLFLLLSVVCFASFGQGYIDIRATPGANAVRRQLLAADVPSNFLRSNATNTMTGNTTIDGAFNFRIGDPFASTVPIFSVTTNGGYGFLSNATGIQLNAPSPATGSMYYRNSSGYTVHLGIGSANQLLASNGTIPAWITNIPITNLNGGSGASSSTWWRGDATWAAPGVSDISGLQTLLDAKQDGDADLTAIAALTTEGIPIKTGAGTWSTSILPQAGTGLNGIRRNSGGTAWEEYAPLQNPATTAEDLIKYNGSAFVRIPVGTNNQALGVSGGVVTYISPAMLAVANTFTANNIFQPTVTTGTGATAGVQVAANSLTTGNGVDISSTSLTSGKLVAISSTSTAATGNTQVLLDVAQSGTNATSAQTTYTGRFRTTKNGTTSMSIGVTGEATGTATTNVGGYFTASGGTTNVAAWFDAGNVGIGEGAPNRTLQLRAATSPIFSMKQGTTEKFILAIAGAGTIITGSNSGDIAYRAENQRMLFSTDAGTSADLILSSGVTTVRAYNTAYVAKTALYTLTATDNVVEVTSGTHTQTLPTAVGIAGRHYFITNSGTGTVTVGTTSSQTFVNQTGTPTTIALTQFHGVEVVSNGANWLVISLF